MTVATRQFKCARCEKRATADRMVFSKHTRNHYCADYDGCARRVRRKR